MTSVPLVGLTQDLGSSIIHAMSGPYSELFFERIAAKLVQEGFIEVREDGSVWRLKCQRSWPGFVPKRVDYGKRYRTFQARYQGEVHSVPVQRLVWQVNKGDIPPGLTVNHKDGNPSNNRLDNLELATQAEQQRHRYRVLGHKASMTVLKERIEVLSQAAKEAVATGQLEGLKATLEELGMLQSG